MAQLATFNTANGSVGDTCDGYEVEALIDGMVAACLQAGIVIDPEALADRSARTNPEEL